MCGEGREYDLDRLRELAMAEEVLETVLERLGEFGQLFIAVHVGDNRR